MMRARTVPSAVLVCLLVLAYSGQIPVARAYSPAVPTLSIALRYQYASHGLYQGTYATVTVYRLVGTSWQRVYGPANHSQGFSIQVPADNATYRVTGTYVDRFGRVWWDTETATVRRNWGSTVLIFNPR